jgi:tetratricopeptide (TPR) repeat protein
MINTDAIERIAPEKLHDPDMLASIEREVLALTNEDDRNSVCYLLATRLITEGNLERAEFFTRLMEAWPIERTWFLGDIAAKLWQSSQKEQALRLLNEATSIARTDGSGSEWQRAEALSKIATHLLEQGQCAQAIGLLREAAQIAQLGQEQCDVQDSLDSASVIGELAEKLALAGDYQQAREIADSIKYQVRRERVAHKIQAIIKGMSKL